MNAQTTSIGRRAEIVARIDADAEGIAGEPDIADADDSHDEPGDLPGEFAEDENGEVRAERNEAACAPGTGLSDEFLVECIARVVERDECALAALYDATLSRVYGCVLRIVRKPALAEEVVADTYFQVWRQAPRFDATRGRALTWLLGMARSRAIDTLRREARFQHESLDGDAPTDPEDDTPTGDDLLEVARNHADLHQALLLLSPQPRQLVALAFFRGLSHEEIAIQTRVPLGTVKSQIRRALATLREVLGADDAPAMASS